MIPWEIFEEKVRERHAFGVMAGGYSISKVDFGKPQTVSHTCNAKSDEAGSMKTAQQ